MQQAVYPSEYQEMLAYYRIRNKLFEAHGINPENLATMSPDNITKELRLCMAEVAHTTNRIIQQLFGQITFIVIMSVVKRCGNNYGQALYDLQYIMRAVPQVFDFHATARTMEMIHETMHDGRAIVAPIVAYALTHDVILCATCSIVHQLSIIPNIDHATSRCIASLFGQASYDTPFRAQCKDMTGQGCARLQSILPSCIAEEYAKQINPEYLWH
jgi:hypothetical protein